MLNILVTGGGTAIAWHLCEVARQHFQDKISMQICDINESYLVPASVYAAKTHRVPNSDSPEYLSAIGKIIDRENIDFIIPLFPIETFLMASDSDFVVQKGIRSAIPALHTAHTLTDKAEMCKFLESIGIPTPHVITSRNQIEGKSKYILKPRFGFGSADIKILSGQELQNEDVHPSFDGQYIIQQYCNGADYDEITVEVFHVAPLLKVFARRRIATKSGVCVKTQPAGNAPFLAYIEKLVHAIEMPTAFNVQFLHHDGEWKMFDCNLRLGAGTALATASGFQLTRAFLAHICGDPITEDLFCVDPDIKSVLRVYKEILIK